MKEIELAEAARRVEECKTAETAQALYDFGEAMSMETLTNTGQLDSKAITILGYAGALFAFLLTSTTSLKEQGWLRFPYDLAVLVAELAALVALLRAVLALRVQTFRILSETDWFQKQLLYDEDPIQLRYFYVLSLHSVNQIGARINGEKSAQVKLAQRWISIAAILIGGMVLSGALPSSLVPIVDFLKIIWVRARELWLF